MRPERKDRQREPADDDNRPDQRIANIPKAEKLAERA
jgi:hypothetical protein